MAGQKEQVEQRIREFMQQLEASGALPDVSAVIELDKRERGMEREFWTRAISEYPFCQQFIQDTESMQDKMRSLHSAIPEQYVENYDRFYDFMQKNEADLQQLMHLRDQFDALITYYETRKKESSSQEEKNEIARILEDIDSMNDVLTEGVEPYRIVHDQCYRIMSLIWEGKTGEDYSSTDMQAFTEALQEAGIDQNELDQMAKAMGAMEKYPTEVYFNIQAFEEQWYEPFLDDRSREQGFQGLSRPQKAVAAENFDRAFQIVFPEADRQALRDEGKDIFDQIYVDGQSLNERYGEKYADMPYYLAIEAMKCEFLADVLAGKKVNAIVNQMGREAVLPLHPDTPNGRIQEKVQNAQRVQGPLSLQETEALRESQERLTERDGISIRRRQERMRDDKPMYADMTPIEPISVNSYNAALYTKTAAHVEQRRQQYYQMSQHAGSLAGKDELVEAGAAWYALSREQLTGFKGNEIDHAIYKQMGIVAEEQLFYIDGIPAEAYMKEHGSPHFSITIPQDRKLLRAEIMAALASGGHRVEMAKVGMDLMGNFQIGITEMQVGMACLDGAEGSRRRAPSEQVRALWETDSGKAKRQEEIRAGFGTRLANAVVKANAPYDNEFSAARRLFSLGQEDLANDYLTPQMRETLDQYENKSPEYFRNNYGVVRTLAHLLIMSEHPEIRLTDSLDSNHHIDRKREAAERVIYAMEELHKTPSNPEPLAEILAKAAQTLGGMDMRQEMLYALGAPENLTPEQAQAVIDDPSNEAHISAILLFASNVAVTVNQAIKKPTRTQTRSVINGRGDLAEAAASIPLYQQMYSKLSAAEWQNYYRADRVLFGFAREQKWNPDIATFREEDQILDALASRYMMQEARDFIAQNGKLAEGFSYLPTVDEKADRMLKHLMTRIDATRQRLGRVPGMDSIEELRAGEYDRNIMRQMVRDAREAVGMDRKKVWEELLISRDAAYDFLNSNASYSPGENMTILLHVMKDYDLTLAEAMAPEHQEKRSAIEETFRESLRQLPYGAEEEAEDKRETARFYGEQFRTIAAKLLNEEIPSIDLNDPNSLAAALPQMILLDEAVKAYRQNIAMWEKEEGFLEGLGGLDQLRQIDQQLELVGMLSSGMVGYLHPSRMVGNELECARAKAKAEIVLPYVAAGRIRDHRTGVDLSVLRRASAAVDAGISQDTVDRRWEDFTSYLAGESTCPVDLRPIQAELETMHRAHYADLMKDETILYPEDIPSAQISAVSAQAKVETMHRPISRKSMAILNLMANENLTMEEAVSVARQAQRQEAARDFVQLLQDNPLVGKSVEEQKSAARNLGARYRRMAERLLNETMPKIDFSDPLSRESAGPQMQMLATLLTDYAQSKRTLESIPEFLEGFGGEESFRAFDENIMKAEFYASAAAMALDPKKRLHERGFGKAFVEQSEDYYAGRRISDQDKTVSVADQFGLFSLCKDSAAEALGDEARRGELQAFVEGRGGFSIDRGRLQKEKDHRLREALREANIRQGLYLMAEEEGSLPEIFQNPLKRQAAKSAFARMQEQYPYTGTDAERDRESARQHGMLYRKIAEGLMQQQIPPVNFQDPNGMREVLLQVELLNRALEDYEQGMTEWTKRDGFQQGFGSLAHRRSLDNRLKLVAGFASAVMIACDETLTSAEDKAMQAGARSYVELMAGSLAGRSIEEMDIARVDEWLLGRADAFMEMGQGSHGASVYQASRGGLGEGNSFAQAGFGKSLENYRKAAPFDWNSLNLEDEHLTELRDKITQIHEEAAEFEKDISAWREAHPDVELDDHIQDFCVMIDCQGLSREERSAELQNTLDDYYSGDPQRRKKVLDEFFDRVESLDLARMDLSLLNSPSQDSEHWDRSREDVERLARAMAYESVIDTKLKENPEYAKERYADPHRLARMQANQRTLPVMRQCFQASEPRVNSAAHAMAFYQDELSAEQGVQTKISFEAKLRKGKDGGLFDLPTGNVKLTEEQIEKASGAFRALFSVHEQFAEKDMQAVSLREIGIEAAAQMFYIDGVNVEDRVKEKYGKIEDPQAWKDTMRAEIMTALMSGERHVEVVTQHLDERGNVQLNVGEVSADFSQVSAEERKAKKLFGKLRSQYAENRVKKDLAGTQKQERQDRIKRDMSERISAAAYRHRKASERWREQQMFERSEDQPEAAVQQTQPLKKRVDILNTPQKFKSETAIVSRPGAQVERDAAGPQK